MPDKRLIDANALVDKVRLDWGLTHQSQLISATTKLAVADAMCKLLGEVAKSPTIDAVEVVRCKDCKHAIVNQNHIEKPLICCKTKMVGTTDPDWFCAAGKRRMDGGAQC